MARHRRIVEPNLIRHVMARGNGRMRIFLDDRDYRTFLRVLSDVVMFFDVECWDYCIMPNHYHLTLYPRKPNLSIAMRQLNSVYAMWWNAVHSNVGHVLQGRFKAQIVQREGYLLALCRYIARNPVRARLVEHPEQWEWSSYRAIAGLCRNPGFLTDGPVLSQFGAGDLAEARARYVDHVLRISPEADQIDDRLRSKERVIGDPEFKAKIMGERSSGTSGSERKSGGFDPAGLEIPTPLI
jgi:REP element-mobilizing transposase RayT